MWPLSGECVVKSLVGQNSISLERDGKMLLFKILIINALGRIRRKNLGFHHGL